MCVDLFPFCLPIFILSASQSLLNSPSIALSQILVRADGKLSGTDDCDGEIVHVERAARVSPGHSPGALTIPALSMMPGMYVCYYVLPLSVDLFNTATVAATLRGISWRAVVAMLRVVWSGERIPD